METPHEKLSTSCPPQHPLRSLTPIFLFLSPNNINIIANQNSIFLPLSLCFSPHLQPKSPPSSILKHLPSPFSLFLSWVFLLPLSLILLHHSLLLTNPILHSFPFPMEPMESLPLETAEEIILRWATEETREKMIFQGDRQKLYRYLQAVDEIQRSKFSHDHIIPIAMARLQDEFRNILISYSNLISNSNLISLPDSNSKEEDDLIRCIAEKDPIPSDAVYHLRCIAERMVSSGYLRECFEVHATVRKSAVNATFRRLGIYNLIHGNVQRLERHLVYISHWVRFALRCGRTVFAREKELCDQIFDGVGTAIDDACFMETVKEHAIQFFNFADAITIRISPRDPKNLFKILELHIALKVLMPDIDRVFDSKSCESIRIRAADSLCRVAETARGIFSEFENAMIREPSKVPAPGGTILPFTMDVMNYLSVISDYRETLNELIVSKPSTGSRYLGDPSTPEMDFAKLEGKPPLAIHLIWIIKMLQFNLYHESKLYNDVSLSHLFIMNNIHYIVEKLKGSFKLEEMIGYDYLTKLTEKFQQAADSYQEATWGRLLSCLREEGLRRSDGFPGVVLMRVLEKRFKAFNALFEKVRRTQTVWSIPDSQLRLDLLLAISCKLTEAYRLFLLQVGEHGSWYRDYYIKYSVEEVHFAVLDLFKGTPVSQNLMRRFLHWRRR